MSEVKVSVIELELAQQRYRIKWPCETTCPWFTLLGGVILPVRDFHNKASHYVTSPEAYAKIQMLNGPHWETMLKVWEVQHRQDLKDKYR